VSDAVYHDLRPSSETQSKKMTRIKRIILHFSYELPIPSHPHTEISTKSLMATKGTAPATLDNLLYPIQSLGPTP
jgi:hypothetical protein